VEFELQPAPADGSTADNAARGVGSRPPVEDLCQCPSSKASSAKCCSAYGGHRLKNAESSPPYSGSSDARTDGRHEFLTQRDETRREQCMQHGVVSSSASMTALDRHCGKCQSVGDDSGAHPRRHRQSNWFAQQMTLQFVLQPAQPRPGLSAASACRGIAAR